MDETVIEKISEQLGIAADKATQLLGQIIPQYAGMQAFNYFSSAFIPLISALLFFISAYLLYRNSKTYVVTDDMEYYEKKEIEKNSLYMLIGVFCCVAFGVLLLFMAVLNICDAVSWLCFPEAHIFQMVLNKF